MKIRKFKLFHLLVLVAVIAIALASLVERRSVVGQSSSHSPDGSWCLNLKLTEYSNLFRSRKILDAAIVHSSNSDWDVATSIPLNDADPETISNRNADYPIVWSDDSSKVTYWINGQLEDWIKIEASETEHKFERKLLSTRVTVSSKPSQTNSPD